MKKTYPSLDELRLHFSYCAESGEIRRKFKTPFNAAGTIATHKNSKGYLKVAFDGTTFAAHRIAFALANGWHAVGCVDHINGKRDDNRAVNLRDVPECANRAHRVSARDGKQSGRLVGAFWNRTKLQWQSQCRGRHIGWFKTEQEAHAAYCLARDARVSAMIAEAAR
jgi:hypothetical protein